MFLVKKMSQQQQKKMTLTEEQEKILRTYNGVIGAFFVVNLVLILHNLYKYIYKLKIYRPLILLFYLFVLLATIARTIEQIGKVLSYIEFFKLQGVFQISARVGLLCMVLVSLTLVLTMHQLYVTLRVISLSLDVEQAKRVILAMRVLICIWGVVFGILMFTDYFGPDKVQRFSLLFFVESVLLIVVYCIIMTMLNFQMKAFEGLDEERRSINGQFVVYLIAYFIRGSFFGTKAFDEEAFRYFPGLVIEASVVFLCNVIPACFVLIQHHRVFKNITHGNSVYQERLSTRETNGEFQVSQGSPAEAKRVNISDTETRLSLQGKQAADRKSFRQLQGGSESLRQTTQGFQIAKRTQSISILSNN